LGINPSDTLADKVPWKAKESDRSQGVSLPPRRPAEASGRACRGSRRKAPRPAQRKATTHTPVRRT